MSRETFHARNFGLPASRGGARELYPLPSGSMMGISGQNEFNPVEPSEPRKNMRDLAAGVFVTVFFSLVFAIPLILAGIMLRFF